MTSTAVGEHLAGMRQVCRSSERQEMAERQDVTSRLSLFEYSLVSGWFRHVRLSIHLIAAPESYSFESHVEDFMLISRWLGRLCLRDVTGSTSQRIRQRPRLLCPTPRLEPLEPRVCLSAISWDGVGDEVHWADPSDSTSSVLPVGVAVVTNNFGTIATQYGADNLDVATDITSNAQTGASVLINRNTAKKFQGTHWNHGQGSGLERVAFEQQVFFNVNAANNDLDLFVGGSAVTWVKKQPAVKVLPQLTVGGSADLTGGTLTISMNAIGTPRKLLDQIQIPALDSLGSSPGPQYLNGQFKLIIQLSEGSTTSAVQSFLRGIKFATKGKGLSTPTRTVNVTLEAGGFLSSISHTINISKKASNTGPGVIDTVSYASLRDADTLRMPNEGYHALASAPDGTVGRVLWQTGTWENGELEAEDALYYGELQPDGSWSEESIPLEWTVGSTILRTVDIDGNEAELFFDSENVPHLLLDSGTALVHLWRDGPAWELELAQYHLPGVTDLFSLESFSAAMGPDGSIHVAFSAEFDESESSPVVYGTNSSGDWEFEVAFDAPGVSFAGGPFQQTGTYARYFQLAVDSQNHAHLVYAPDFQSEAVNGGSHVYSELAYATNRSGSWVTEIIDRPADGTGDSGLAASIAIDPETDRPAIASFFVDRVGTGSPTNGRLYYHAQQADRSWTHQTVASASDGYVARDGNQGTGFAPLLVFDGTGRANILFSDYASQHFPGFGADEFAGQLRHARLNGSVWRVQTVFRQTDPIRNYLIHPAFAMSGNRVTYLAVWRRDVLGQQSEVIDYSKKLLELTVATFQ